MCRMYVRIRARMHAQSCMCRTYVHVRARMRAHILQHSLLLNCVLVLVTTGLKTVILELPRTTPNASNSACRNITQRLVDAISKPVSGPFGTHVLASLVPSIVCLAGLYGVAMGLSPPRI